MQRVLLPGRWLLHCWTLQQHLNPAVRLRWVPQQLLLLPLPLAPLLLPLHPAHQLLWWLLLQLLQHQHPHQQQLRGWLWVLLGYLLLPACPQLLLLLLPELP